MSADCPKIILLLRWTLGSTDVREGTRNHPDATGECIQRLSQEQRRGGGAGGTRIQVEVKLTDRQD